MIRKFIKYLASLSPVPLTKNEYYDRLTEQVIKKVCSNDSVCVDVGANEGKILSMFIQHCPQAVHYAFEPIPGLYFLLVRKYGSAAKISKVALSNKKGSSSFIYVPEDAAYSSLKQRLDQDKKTTQIEVETDLLDNVIPGNVEVTLIKLDIEGGEYDALLGAKNTITRCKPYILFEFGKGGSDAFGVTAEMMFELFVSLGYKISLIDVFLKSGPGLKLDDFVREYETGSEYFFIAHP